MNESPPSYPVPPPIPDGMTPDNAARSIKEVMAAAAQDPQHPYSHAGHPLHRDYQDFVGKLFQIKATAADAGETPTSRACMEALAERDAKRDMMQEEAEKEVEALRKLGYEGEAPADVRPDQLTALKMQRLAAQQDLDALTPIMERELRALKAPADTMAAFQAFTHARDMDPALRGQIAEQVVSYIHAANEQRYGKGRK